MGGSSFFTEGPEGDELAAATALARAWAISDTYPDPTNYPGMRSARWYALNQALTDHVDVTITTPVSGEFLTYNGTEWVNAPFSGTSMEYTPANLSDWEGGVDPGTVSDALDVLAARSGSIAYLYQLTDVVIGDVGDGDGGTQPLESNNVLMWNGFEWINHPVDASWCYYSPGTVTDWNTLTPISTIALALDEIAGRMKAAEAVLGADVSANDVLFSPATLADWVDGVDPGDVNDALDQLAGRVATLEAAPGGSGGTKTYATFTPMTSQPPAANFATLDTRNSVAVLDFDAATDESIFWVGIMPEAASLAAGLKIRIHWMATSATSGTCRWGAQIERMNTDLDSDSFDTAGTAGTATNGTSGVPNVTEITLTTIDGVTAGDLFRLRVYRDADGTSGTDDMAGDAELIAVEVRSAA